LAHLEKRKAHLPPQVASSYLINTYILVPFEMEYLRTIAVIVTIAGVVGYLWAACRVKYA
jgi:Na+-translocating ferredoxin:NAD+ oxidoreductase RnfA subunit